MQNPAGCLFLCRLLTLLLVTRLSVADVGTAALYRPPYIPTACFGGDASQFPSDRLFAAAGEGIWDNGAACGRRYLVRCLSSAVRRACAAGQPTVRVTIVDRAATAVSPPTRKGSTMVLSVAAFGAITNASARGIQQINVEYAET